MRLTRRGFLKSVLAVAAVSAGGIALPSDRAVAALIPPEPDKKFFPSAAVAPPAPLTIVTDESEWLFGYHDQASLYNVDHPVDYRIYPGSKPLTIPVERRTNLLRGDRHEMLVRTVPSYFYDGVWTTPETHALLTNRIN